VRNELEQLGVVTFGDLERELVLMATDITRGRLLHLPWDYPRLDLDPDEQLVADAVRASISIPLFFEPVKLSDRTLVDGGVLSNFPIEIFDAP
jgi:NTE family protein